MPSRAAAVALASGFFFAFGVARFAGRPFGFGSIPFLQRKDLRVLRLGKTALLRHAFELVTELGERRQLADALQSEQLEKFLRGGVDERTARHVLAPHHL